MFTLNILMIVFMAFLAIFTFYLFIRNTNEQSVYQGLINKSRTYDFGTLITAMGAAQVYLPDLGLSQLTVGVINMVIGMVIVYLRKITTGPVGKK